MFKSFDMVSVLNKIAKLKDNIPIIFSDWVGNYNPNGVYHNFRSSTDTALFTVTCSTLSCSKGTYRSEETRGDSNTYSYSRIGI